MLCSFATDEQLNEIAEIAKFFGVKNAPVQVCHLYDMREQVIEKATERLESTYINKLTDCENMVERFIVVYREIIELVRGYENDLAESRCELQKDINELKNI